MYEIKENWFSTQQKIWLPHLADLSNLVSNISEDEGSPVFYFKLGVH